LDQYVTDVDELPIVIHPLPEPVVPKPDKPPKPSPTPDEAAKAIQNAARAKAVRKKGEHTRA
jgi:hypothetical protein